jgi:hypothetical protein
MNIDELTLGQIKKLKSIFANDDACCTEDLGVNIVVLQRGWVVVGNLQKNGVEYSLTKGAVIRSWGTTKGLGEIAENGPTVSTQLDPIPDSKFHELTSVIRIKCDEVEWKNKIK